MVTSLKRHRLKLNSMFKSERDLQSELAAQTLDLRGPKNIFSRREVPLGGIIPDLVYVRFQEIPDPNLWPRRWAFRHAVVLWLLRYEQELSIYDMAERCFVPPNSMKETVVDLLKSNAIQQVHSGRFTLSIDMLNIEAEVIAVEAKISRWQRALDQAISYLDFADKVFVAMDPVYTPRSGEILQQFSSLGIGLCAIQPQEKDWLVYPKIQSKVLEATREYLIASAASTSRQSLWSLM